MAWCMSNGQRTAAATPAPAADRPPATLAAPGPRRRDAAGHLGRPCGCRKDAAHPGRARRHHPHHAASHARRTARAGGVRAGRRWPNHPRPRGCEGLADELRDRGYLVIDGVDGKAHYVALNARDELANYPTGAVVEVKDSANIRAADKNIAALASDGLYRADHHLAIEQGRAKAGRDPQEVVAAHVRRLEALRRAGIVERVADGLWKVPDDLAERGRQYDAQRLGDVAVQLKSHLAIERQARVIGATWLDQQLIGGGRGMGDLGFGGDAKQALQQRIDFLEEQGLAQRRGQRVILARNLLGTLRNREIAQAAEGIAIATGLEHRPIADGQRVVGIYRRSLMLVSGRYALLDHGKEFSLVPWRPVIEQRLGQQIAATVHGNGVAWDFRKQRGL